MPNDQPKIIEGELLARDLRFALIAARFNDFVVDALVRGALDALRRHGVNDKQIDIVRVPGAFDMPIVARKLALSRRYEALIALGAVIRGQTPHFEYVAGECAGGLALRRRRDDRTEEGDVTDVDDRRADVVADGVHAFGVAGPQSGVKVGDVGRGREVVFEADVSQ